MLQDTTNVQQHDGTNNEDYYQPGDVVLTKIGICVLTTCRRRQDKVDDGNEQVYYKARLWRTPGKSVGSCAIAHLQPDLFVRKMPAAPGMVTKQRRQYSVGDHDDDKDDSKNTNETTVVMVHSYSVSKDMYVVHPYNMESNTMDMTESIELKPHELEPAPCAIFYPLLEELMKRGDETAAATTALFNQKAVTDIVEKTTSMVESSVTAQSKKLPDQDKVVHNIMSKVQDVIPDEGEIKQVYTMLKDEELTALLQKGKERLEQLMQKDIPEATKVALEKTGITFVQGEDGDNAESPFLSSIAKSRETALSTLEELLVQNANMDFATAETTIRQELETNFGQMFDSMQMAAQSDKTLNSIFETVSEKTSEWQEASGRLMSTKSAGLFMEGANRLQARAAAIFSQDQLHWAGQIGTNLTRSFTEGDAAVARLKSIELGDAVKSRLFEAIEMRTGSEGGLDAIIAGALSTVKGKSKESEDQVQTMLHDLQNSATSATKDASETLISVLSERSEYRDVALLRIERTLCDLKSHLGNELSPEDIAALAKGEGGTSALFEPIARKAAKEIEKQLDSAESSVTDPSMLSALQHVRKIISGELTVTALLNETVSILNNDDVVAAGETFMKTSEDVLDALEGVSGNKVVDDALEIAQKAGITKDVVMKQMEGLNVNEVLDTAQDAITNEKARRKLVSSATDTALDFILRILPAMEIPPFDGVKEGMIYHLSNLSLKGFKVKKEDIMVEIAGMRATKPGKTTPEPLVESQHSVQVASTPSITSLDSELAPSDVNSSFHSVDSQGFVFEDNQTGSGNKIDATELLIIDVHNISSVMNDLVWSFEQTYMPYLKGGGMANVQFSGGSIRLQFELRKRKKDQTDGEVQWEPVLCLHDRSCAIEEVNLVLQGEGRLTWILNKLAAIFKGPLRDYVVATIKNMLTSQSGALLEKLNGILSPYWNLILSTAKLELDKLVETDEEVIIAHVPDEDEGLFELVWKERLPLGMNLLLNDRSGLLKVVDFPRGSQARSVCESQQIDPVVFEGATIVGVNGTRYDERALIFDALKDPSRPKAVLFELAKSEDAERIKRFVAGKNSTNDDSDSDNREADFYVETLNFTENGELGIQFSSSPDDFGLVVKNLHKSPDGIVFAAERYDVSVGDLLSHVNGQLVLGASGCGKDKALSLLKEVGGERPLALSFVKPYLVRKTFEKPTEEMSDSGGPEEFILKEQILADGTKRIAVRGFSEIPGMAEASGVMIGDHLIFINGRPVGAGCRMMGEEKTPDLQEVYEILRDKNNYPIGLTFARPKTNNASRWKVSSSTKFDLDTADTVCVMSETFEQLGCIFGSDRFEVNMLVSDLFAVPGCIQEEMKPYRDLNGKINFCIESINGQFVPSYASPSIVLNALRRSWSSDGRMEVLFCDDERKTWTRRLT